MEEKTYEIKISDKINIETALFIYIEGEKETIKKLTEQIKNCESTIKSLEKTQLKIRGFYNAEEQPDIYDEKLNGVWEHIK